MAAMTSAQQMPRSNHLLAALPAASYERIAAHLECMSMPLGETLYESGLAPHQAYFPTTAIISLHQVMEDGASSEFANVGNEGMIGLPLVMGGHTPPGLATVCAGGAGQVGGRRGGLRRRFVHHFGPSGPCSFSHSIVSFVFSIVWLG